MEGKELTYWEATKYEVENRRYLQSSVEFTDGDKVVLVKIYDRKKNGRTRLQIETSVKEGYFLRGILRKIK